jgi:hypothetical protein
MGRMAVAVVVTVERCEVYRSCYCGICGRGMSCVGGG